MKSIKYFLKIMLRKASINMNSFWNSLNRKRQKEKEGIKSRRGDLLPFIISLMTAAKAKKYDDSSKFHLN